MALQKPSLQESGAQNNTVNDLLQCSTFIRMNSGVKAKYKKNEERYFKEC